MQQQPSSDVAFTDAVKAVQTRRHSRSQYERLEARGGFKTEITSEIAGFLTDIDTAFLATATSAGQPYAQHRGGPKGFIKVLGSHTIGFADYSGNRQYISVGNLSENQRAFLILMDYVHRRRVKIWGRARISEDADVMTQLMPAGYNARPEQAILFDVDAWDANCPRHIPQKFDAVDVSAALDALQAKLDAAEAELTRLRTGLASSRAPTGEMA